MVCLITIIYPLHRDVSPPDSKHTCLRQWPESWRRPGFPKQTRFEGDIEELEVSGKIPSCINGTYFSIQTDHRYAPKYEHDVLFNGDGAVSAFRIFEEHVDRTRRYVQTDRFNAESDALRALFGRYRNPYTDGPSVRHLIRTAANTNIVFWRGVMLALKEDGPPFALDPVTLQTIGRYDFEGQVLSLTFSAHPKIDPVTSEIICFGYEAGGNGNDASRDIIVCTIGPDQTFD
ncbi:retinal pigment epithelial membrane protein-domain-containing protein [Pyrenochaeta sp. MPI-SDFR-AT-0127]|nr:retinal pigment epithelial membrane protein-domain-containing protein [Pyrenochaeta sp. MPI-SDFR-AT-0127]